MTRRWVSWLLIWLVPMVPVVVLYILFESYNLFEFQDAPGGIKAAGPIGAYLVLLMLALRHRAVLEDGESLTAPEKRLLGDWSLTSRSLNGTEATGRCTVSSEGGDLSLSGSFSGHGGLTSTWKSTMTKLDGSVVLVVYELNDLARQEHSQALMRLVLEGTPSPTAMEGDWAVVGRKDAAGTVRFSRAGAAAPGAARTVTLPSPSSEPSSAPSTGSGPSGSGGAGL